MTLDELAAYLETATDDDKRDVLRLVLLATGYDPEDTGTEVTVTNTDGDNDATVEIEEAKPLSKHLIAGAKGTGI